MADLLPADIPILCFDAPLYKPYAAPPYLVAAPLGPGRAAAFATIAAGFTKTADRYCTACQSLSVFRGRAAGVEDSNVLPAEGLMVKVFECSRDRSHLALFLFRLDGNAITKIGQWPSLADFAEGDIARYSKRLDKVRNGLAADFKRAIGLFAHGVGAGSLVYLRRIIEALFEEAHTEAKADEGWNEEAYKSARMSERIDVLKARLPDFVVSHKALYGILSDGIHNLPEDECLAHFPLLRASIELILDARIEREERARKTAEAQKAVAAVEAKFKARKAEG